MSVAEEDEQVTLEDWTEQESTVKAAAAPGCCTAAGFVVGDESLLIVLWKKAETAAELLCTSHVLFLEALLLLLE